MYDQKEWLVSQDIFVYFMKKPVPPTTLDTDKVY